MKSSFRNELPRVYELKDMLEDPCHRDAFFQDLEQTLEEPRARAAFRKLERWLDVLDDAAWQTLKLKAVPHLVSRQREIGRGWQEHFDVLNEARAFGYLQCLDCTEVHFIECSDNKRTPDLGALQDGRPVFCEVKTINPSDDAAQKQLRIAKGVFDVESPRLDVDEGFLRKLRATLTKALEQLDAVDRERHARRIIFTMLNFDDWWGDHQDRYIAQIDADLLQNPLDGVALVFCLSRKDLWQRSFTMESATFLPE
ncbi:MAG: hypothetical protein OXT71_06050 [Acidobacteriota bacterium]|nr:hypothetical protein [Acidobacteriota bacterium]